MERERARMELGRLRKIYEGRESVKRKWREKRRGVGEGERLNRAIVVAMVVVVEEDDSERERKGDNPAT